MDAANASPTVPTPVRVEPDELVRLGAGLRDLAGVISREVPAATGLTASSPGWSVRYAQARLVHEVNAHLTALSGDLAEFGERLRVAGLSYADRDSGLARRIAAAGEHR
jgi:hypothetical protein